MSCPDETEDTGRDVQSMTNDGHSISFLSPGDQAKEDQRKAQQCGLKRTRSLARFLRMFRISTRDVP